MAPTSLKPPALAAMALLAAASAQGVPEGWQRVDVGFTTATWSTTAGRWSVAGSEYVQSDTAQNPAYAFAPDAVVSDFEYTVRLRAEPVGRAMNAGLVFRATDSGHFYYAQIGIRHRQVVLVRAEPKREWIEIARRRGLELAAGRWHEVKVAAAGQRIRISLDGQCVIDTTDGALSVGCVGLRTGFARVRFIEPELVGRPAILEKEWSMVPTDWTPEDLPKIQGGERVIAASGEVGSGMFPKLLKLPDEELVALVRGGAPHIGAGGRIDLIRSTDGGRTWSKPVNLPKTSDDDRGPSIGLAADGALVCAYRIYDAYDENGKRREGTPRQVTMVTLSHDHGHTWTRPEEIKLPAHDFVAPFQRMVCLADGTMLMPAYTGQGALVLRSRDNGRTWGDVTAIGPGFNEYAMLRLPDGRLLAAMRRKQSGLSTTFSSDQGRTWSEPRQATKGALHPADLVMLPSGHVLLMYGRRRAPYGVEARLSEDLGATWGDPLLLAWTAANTDCGYPSAVVLDDGTVVMLWYAVGSVEDGGLGWHCEAVRFKEGDVVKGLAAR